MKKKLVLNKTGGSSRESLNEVKVILDGTKSNTANYLKSKSGKAIVNRHNENEFGYMFTYYDLDCKNSLIPMEMWMFVNSNFLKAYGFGKNLRLTSSLSLKYVRESILIAEGVIVIGRHATVYQNVSNWKGNDSCLGFASLRELTGFKNLAVKSALNETSHIRILELMVIAGSGYAHHILDEKNGKLVEYALSEKYDVIYLEAISKRTRDIYVKKYGFTVVSEGKQDMWGCIRFVNDKNEIKPICTGTVINISSDKSTQKNVVDDEFEMEINSPHVNLSCCKNQFADTNNYNGYAIPHVTNELVTNATHIEANIEISPSKVSSNKNLKRPLLSKKSKSVKKPKLDNHLSHHLEICRDLLELADSSVDVLTLSIFQDLVLNYDDIVGVFNFLNDIRMTNDMSREDYDNFKNAALNNLVTRVTDSTSSTTASLQLENLLDSTLINFETYAKYCEKILNKLIDVTTQENIDDTIEYIMYLSNSSYGYGGFSELKEAVVHIVEILFNDLKLNFSKIVRILDDLRSNDIITQEFLTIKYDTLFEMGLKDIFSPSVVHNLNALLDSKYSDEEDLNTYVSYICVFIQKYVINREANLSDMKHLRHVTDMLHFDSAKKSNIKREILSSVYKFRTTINKK